MNPMNAFQDASREAQSFLADSAVKYYGEVPPAHDRVEVRFACGGQAQVHMSLLCHLLTCLSIDRPIHRSTYPSIDLSRRA